jgi:hypothetical protein
MNNQRWYSGTLRFFTVTAAEGRVDGEDSIYLVRASDWEEAFRRFLEIGYKKETTYKNWLEQETRVRFISIRTMDVLDEEDLDGIEVSCVPLDGEDPQFTFETPVNPESSKPGQLGV